MPSDAVTIRQLEADDRADWQNLWQDYLAFYETTRPAELFDLAFARLLNEDEHEFTGLLAITNDRPIGLAHVLSHRHGWYEDNVLYLQDLFVDPAARGKGAARALIAAARDLAVKAHAPALYWLTAEDNHIAQKLYDRVAAKTGFVKYQISIN